VLGISFDETTTREDVATLFKLIAQSTLDIDTLDAQVAGADAAGRPAAQPTPSSPTRCSTRTTPNTRCCAT
jgi:hypothetical protein